MTITYKKIYSKVSNLECPHAFSTRIGGVSNGDYASLNLGFSYGDDLNCVKQNWEIFSKATSVKVDKLFCCEQIHGGNVEIIDNAMYDKNNFFNIIPKCDGLVTKDKGLTLSVFTADCVPVLIHDPQNEIIADLHCGWKPFVADILKNGIEKMISVGANIKNLKVGIGPCISYDCFEVGEEVVDAFNKLLGNTDAKNFYKKSTKAENKFYADLQGGVACRLKQLGISSENIELIDECTYSNPDKYFSYRYAGKKTGLIASIISL